MLLTLYFVCLWFWNLNSSCIFLLLLHGLPLLFIGYQLSNCIVCSWSRLHSLFVSVSWLIFFTISVGSIEWKCFDAVYWNLVIWCHKTSGNFGKSISVKYCPKWFFPFTKSSSSKRGTTTRISTNKYEVPIGTCTSWKIAFAIPSILLWLNTVLFR